MSPDSSPVFAPGTAVVHPQFGEGGVLAMLDGQMAQVFFAEGQRTVPVASLSRPKSREAEILGAVAGDAQRLRKVRLAHLAHALPLMANASALTSAPIDLLPHQVVLTHRVAAASPRRFLVADEVGLGKTIETALILRELASRGELTRALMVVPAGLVHNWHRELNEVFGLDFEVFGSEGDVTDRKTNAFAKHHFLIASIDTLKRPARIKRLLEAPKWDLVVFDEAHHLTATRSGRSVKKTENYKLAEALKGHARDLILLSATPHQGDHFRFWMLCQLLNPALFRDPQDMLDNRHRLNAVVFRRTKADACRPDGSPLFARRGVHTEAFSMNPQEQVFYTALVAYLADGFALAKRIGGGKGQALGFVMTIFQKIAASSFAAVRRTLQRRLLGLTLHEAIVKDQALDVDGRDALMAEVRRMVRQEQQLPDSPVGHGQCDKIVADLKVRLLKKLDEEALAAAMDPDGGEVHAGEAEDMAGMTVDVALPMERQRIGDLLALFPTQKESKAEKLVQALRSLWEQNPQEKIVIFATYLGTVDLIGREIEAAFPDKGVVVLRGGDHGSKVAAEKRFRRPDGPRVMVCTAAGREGINLQFARVLFNFDLPWNPMDVEQRIGRIHRYGQKDTAQVYNLVLGDTIEGKIFLLLESKLEEIAKTLGKANEHGVVTEDLRSQILGQLYEKISYDELYREALKDPTLRRTREELAAAMDNAKQARVAVNELFQDLERFSLSDYQPFSDTSGSLQRIALFLEDALADAQVRLRPGGASGGGVIWELQDSEGARLKRFATDREQIKQDESLELLGLDHALVVQQIRQWQAIAPMECGTVVKGAPAAGVLTCWRVEIHAPSGERSLCLLYLAASWDGKRLPILERNPEALLSLPPGVSVFQTEDRNALLKTSLTPMVEREIRHKGLLPDHGSYRAELLLWVETE